MTGGTTDSAGAGGGQGSPGADGPWEQMEHWPAKAADGVDAVVATVHDRVIRPILVVARALVFGAIIAVSGLVALVLVSVGLLRLLDVYAFPGRVWASYALLGVVFSAAGLAAWSRRNQRH